MYNKLIRKDFSDLADLAEFERGILELLTRDRAAQNPSHCDDA